MYRTSSANRIVTVRPNPEMLFLLCRDNLPNVTYFIRDVISKGKLRDLLSPFTIVLTGFNPT
jgi:hypothetical protein